MTSATASRLARPSIAFPVAAIALLVLSTVGQANHVTLPLPSPAPAMSSVRDETSAVWTGSLALAFGGRPTSGAMISEIVKYDPSTNTLTTSPNPLPSGRRCTAAVWDPNAQAAYIIGGSNTAGTALTEIVRYIPSSNTVTANYGTLPAARNCPAAAWSGGSAYIFGGCCDGLGNNVAGVVKFTPGAGSTTLTPSGSPASLLRCCHSAVSDGGTKIYLFGGSDNGGTARNDVIQYDVSANSVTVLSPTLPTGRMFTASVWDPASSSAFVYGGFPAVNEIVKVTVPTSTSTVTGAFPSARGFMSAAFTGTIAYLFGGNAGGTFLSEIRRHDPDNAAPTASIGGLPATAECTSPSGATLTAVGSGSDPDGDALTYAWTAAGASIANPTLSTTNIAFPFGATNVGLTVTDAWTHTGSASTTVTVVDTTAPVTTASVSGSAGTNGWYRSAVTVTLTPSEACSVPVSTVYSLDGGAFTSGTTVSVSTQGTHTLQFRSTDSRGNAEATKSIALNLDFGVPTVDLTDPVPSTLYLFDVPQALPMPVTTIVGGKTLRATASDTLSGIDHVEFLLDGQVIGSDTTAPYSFFWLPSLLNLDILLHTVSARAVDQAGNTDEETLQVLVVPTGP